MESRDFRGGDLPADWGILQDTVQKLSERIAAESAERRAAIQKLSEKATGHVDVLAGSLESCSDMLQCQVDEIRRELADISAERRERRAAGSDCSDAGPRKTGDCLRQN